PEVARRQTADAAAHEIMGIGVEQVEEGRKVLADDRIDNDVERSLRGVVRVKPVPDRRGAKRKEALAPVAGRGCSDHIATAQTRQLHAHEANAATRAAHQYAFA